MRSSVFPDLLEKHLDDKEKVHDYIKKIQLSGSFLLSLINYVLEMARIENAERADIYGQKLGMPRNC